MRLPKAGFNFLRCFSPANHETQITGGFRQWREIFAGLGGHGDFLNSRHCERVSLSSSFDQEPGAWDRHHHDAGGSPLALESGQIHPDRMAEDQFL